MLCAARPALIAQQMQHSAPSVPSTQLTIRTYEGKTLTLSPNELAALPHKSVVVFNAHNKANETYSGVPLADLLSKAGVPLGESVRGKLFMTGIVAEGTDNYGVLYSLAEVDPSIHTGDVIVADMLDGKKLEKDGAFKMVSSEERRPARWVRNLTAISVVKVEP
jgi:Oxidoreductase molybdopterin binding domain